MSRKLATEVRSGITVSLPPDLVKQLNAYCLKFHLSRSSVAEVAMRRFILFETQKEMNRGDPERETDGVRPEN